METHKIGFLLLMAMCLSFGCTHYPNGAWRAIGGGDAAIPVRPLPFIPSEDDFFIRFGGKSKLTILETAAAIENLLGKDAAKALASHVDFRKERVALVSWTTAGPPDGLLKHEFEGEGKERRLVF